MIVDSSALVAIVIREPDWEILHDKLASARIAGIGAPTLVETGIVLTARIGRDARSLVSGFVREAGISTVAFGDDHWRAAIGAFIRYGKGRHAAALNFGDCMSYAVASVSGHALLCTGSDFAMTDLEIA